MTTSNRQLSQRQQVRTALERISDLEQQMPQIIVGINQALNAASTRASELASVIEAISEILGTEVVDAKIKEISERKALQNLASAQDALQKGLEDGSVVKTDSITANSLVVGRELDKDGNPVFPGRVQLTYAAIRPDFQKKLLGQSAGFVFSTSESESPNPEDGKFEVLEVYNIVPKPEVSEQSKVETPASLEKALDDAKKSVEG